MRNILSGTYRYRVFIICWANGQSTSMWIPWKRWM